MQGAEAIASAPFASGMEEMPMSTVKTVMAELKSKGKENTRAIYARHGIPIERTFGVSNADLKVIAKTIKKQQELALELYDTGVMDAMYLAGIVADGAQMTKKQLQAWADGAADMPMIAEYTVAWVAVENAHGRELALEWMKSKKELVAAAGWCTYSGLVATKADDALDLKELEGLLKTVVAKVHTAPNRVRATMKGLVIAVATYVAPLLKQAKAAAKEMGAVSVDVGDTDCTVRQAAETIAKVEAAGKVGKKRKTIRC
jgi:3-methyladenine DNA glycosylase AlkD